MKDTAKKPRRVRPLLLALLWVWVICMAVVLDLFLNVEEFDSLRPRSSLYRGMRIAAHKMVGQPIDKGEHGRTVWRGRMLAEVETKADVRAMVRFCETATPTDRTKLREIALTTDDTLAASNAIRALGRLRAVADDPQLLALLHDDRARVRHEVVRALGASRSDNSIPILEPLLEHDDDKMQLLAIQALGRIGGKRATSRLERILADGSATAEQRAFARAALH